MMILKGESSMDTDFEIRDHIRTVLIECRKEKGITQSELGKVVGKSKTAVASWEQGLSLPDAATLYRLAAYYQKSISHMYGEDK